MSAYLLKKRRKYFRKKIALLKIKVPSFDFKSLVLTFQKTLLLICNFSLHRDVSPENAGIQEFTSGEG
ncbi:hypothetical protein DXD68_06235 [Parabacteroides sp. TM07-1AC]|nr:hypothetical protein DXD68_06235 [Parabacteroides sp. TM07-1AC]